MFRFSVRENKAHLVKWREWGPEAFQEARSQNKPVLLFLVAFWCGFCQRMDETSLSNDEAIALLNAFFVPIRVEESQRPDVDLRYNQNGWPTIACLTPAGDHIFSANYMEPDAFVDLLVKVVSLHQQGNQEANAAVQGSHMPAVGDTADPAGEEEKPPLGPAIVAEIAGMVEGLADRVNGGYGAEFKFLHAEANDFLLYLYETTGEAAFLEHVESTLDKMRLSPTFDSKDGGFFRYSSKADWSEPHPEKLLDDQAALLRNYLRAFLLTEKSAHKEAAEGLIEYLDATLYHGPSRAFFGCQDYVRQADSAPAGQTAASAAMTPVIDRYVYCDANARAVSAYLEAWWVLGRDDCLQRAKQVLETLWQKLQATGGGMYHYWDGQAQVAGLLEDSVATGGALLDAYAVLHEADYLRKAKELAQQVIRRHRNPSGGYYDISETGPASLQFPITVLPQNARVAAFFVRLAALDGNPAHKEQAIWALETFPNAHRRYGAFAAGFGHALARLLGSTVKVTVAGPPGHESVRALARAALTGLGCGDVVLRFRAQPQGSAPQAGVEVAGRTSRPITDPAAFNPQLAEALVQG